MKLKKILTTVLTLCFVVTALAGVASARDIGDWTLTIAKGKYFTGTVTQTKEKAKTSAVINVITEGKKPGYIYNNDKDDDNYGKPAGMNWSVLMLNSGAYVKATNTGAVFSNERQYLSYSSQYDSYINRECKLQLYNYNSFPIRTQGTWSPDQN